MIGSKKTEHMDVKTYYKKSYAGTIRVPEGTEHIHMVTGWDLPIIEVSKSPQTFAVFIEPRHNMRHPTMW